MSNMYLKCRYYAVWHIYILLRNVSYTAVEMPYIKTSKTLLTYYHAATDRCFAFDNVRNTGGYYVAQQYCNDLDANMLAFSTDAELQAVFGMQTIYIFLRIET